MNPNPAKEKLVESLLDILAYKSLYPPQKLALDSGVMNGTNLLITTPTASGKTLVAMMAILGALEKNQKAVYLTPLRALAAEKHEELRILERLYPDRQVKVVLSTSDYDSAGKELASADIIVLTNEKMDSLFRHGAEWIGEVGLFISDEVHLIGDRERGPALEMMLTRIRKDYHSAHLLALSATVANSDEIAQWLQCTKVSSDWRPTRLVEGVFEYGSIRTNDEKTIPVPRSASSGAAIDVAVQALIGGGQSLIFAETRKRAVSLAVKASETVGALLDTSSRKAAKEISSKVLQTDDSTELAKILSQVVRNGVGFHHAGLSQPHRQLIEQSFREGKLKLLTSTPTLAAGVNLPARRVVLASIVRFDSEYGASVPISVLDYKQLSGRAGRPQYDTFGESVIVAEHGVSSEEIYEHYVLGKPEPLRSQLSGDKAQRFHLLSTIASYPGMKEGDIFELFSRTLFARQNSKSVVEFKVSSALEFLESEGLVVSRNGRFLATEFGRRISLLYIDPLTGVEFKRAILGATPSNSQHTLGLLHLISNSSDFFPKFGLRKKDYEMVANLLANHSDELLYPTSEYDSSRSFWALSEWIEESSEATISESAGIEPGDLHRLVESALWLSYALYEVAKLVHREDLLQELSELRTRIRYGVKRELVSLVSLEGIGRIRARSLYDAGFRSVSDLAKAPQAKIASVGKIGPVVAKKVKDQLINRSVR